MTPIEFIPADELAIADVASLARSASDATAKLQAASSALSRAQRNLTEAQAAVTAAETEYVAAQANFATVYAEIQSTISRDIP